MRLEIDGTPIKIGKTINLLERHKQLERYYGCPLSILAAIPGDIGTEAEIHARSYHLRLGDPDQNRRPELFRPESDLMNFISDTYLVVANPYTIEVAPARVSIIPPGEKMVRVSLSHELHDEFRRMAAAHGPSMAAMARTIIAKAIDEWEKS